MKEKIKYFFNRKAHDKRSNLLLVVVLLVALLIASAFLPLLKVNCSVGMKSENFGEQIQVFELGGDVLETSASDFLSFKQLPGVKLFGTRISDIGLFGISFYDILMLPLPDLSFIGYASNFLNTGGLDFLTSKPFKEFCHEMGGFGDFLIDAADGLHSFQKKGGEILGKVADVVAGVDTASKNIRKAVNTINSYFTIADVAMLILFLMPILAVILLIAKKGGVLPKILLTFFSLVMLLIGLATIIINSSLATMTSIYGGELNGIIDEFIYGLVPSIKNVLKSTEIIKNIFFEFDIHVVAGIGWWLLTVTSLGATILTYLMPRAKKATVEIEQVNL